MCTRACAGPPAGASNKQARIFSVEGASSMCGRTPTRAGAFKKVGGTPRMSAGIPVIRLIVEPASNANGERRPGCYAAYLDDRLVAVSRVPFFDAARILLARGFPGEARLVMRWNGAEIDSLSARLDVAAGLTVEERPSSTPSIRFTRYRPRPVIPAAEAAE